MKKIDKLVMMSFIPPYLMAFFVAEFVLVMQFLWKYIDEIIGKGFSMGVLIELIFYFAVRIIPEAVPVSILIASVMVFGNMSEKFELSSMKSAGISLTRIMGAGILISILTAMFSLFASNYLKPKANYQFLYRFNAIRKQKPALSIEEGIFNKDFRNFVIRVGKKYKDGKTIEDILIYDQSQLDKSKVNLVKARRGKMYASEDGNFFIMELEDGESYRELKPGQKPSDIEPFIRTRFKSWSRIFDMSEFELEARNLNLNRKKYDLMNALQLVEAVDSFDLEIVKNIHESAHSFERILAIDDGEPKVVEEESELPEKVRENVDKLQWETYVDNRQKLKRRNADFQLLTDVSPNEVETLAELLNQKSKEQLLRPARLSATRRLNEITKKKKANELMTYDKRQYILRLNQQFSFALVCIVFLFIGAPLGSIVRKGGYGYPLLIAIIFFMLFIILNIMGEKLSRNMTLDPVFAAWLPNMVMIPIAVYLTIKAMNDSKFNNWKLFFNKVASRFSKN